MASIPRVHEAILFDLAMHVYNANAMYSLQPIELPPQQPRPLHELLVLVLLHLELPLPLYTNHVHSISSLGNMLPEASWFAFF
jgi:hypothetical protein